MIFRNKQLTSLVIIFIMATIYSFFIINRWIVTDLGLLSYGRVWPLYVSWFDFGFFRRGLVGTIFSETQLNTIFENEYVFAIVAHHFIVLILVILLTVYCFQRSITNRIFLLGLAFSPALIIHSGYNTGTLDVFVLIVAVLNILFVRGTLSFCFLLVIGVLIHELFIFTIPAQLHAFYFLDSRKKPLSLTLLNIMPVITVVLAVAVIALFGKTDFSEVSYNAIMKQNIPNAFNQHGLWSGFIEINDSAFKENLRYCTNHVISLFLDNGYHPHKYGFIFFIPGVLYIIILTARALQFTPSRLEMLMLVFAVLFPLMAAFVATDLHRWVSLSANMALLLTLRLMRDDGSETSKWNAVLCIFCFLAPFGAADYDKPFPVHRFALEKLLN